MAIRIEEKEHEKTKRSVAEDIPANQCNLTSSPQHTHSDYITKEIDTKQQTKPTRGHKWNAPNDLHSFES